MMGENLKTKGSIGGEQNVPKIIIIDGDLKIFSNNKIILDTKTDRLKFGKLIYIQKSAQQGDAPEPAAPAR